MHVLLIHGALGSASQLEPLVPLLGASVTTHTLELEGHGATASQHGYDMRRFAANVRDYMSAKRIERAAIFGYSMGGYVGLLLAAESPELVTSVATLGTKLGWSPEIAVRETKRLDAATIRAKVPAFAAQLAQRHAGAGGWELVLQRTAAMMTGLGAHPVLTDEMLKRIAQPARLMVGDRDTVVSLEETSAASKLIPKGELAVLPGTPHPFEQAKPELVASLLRAFLV